MEITTVFTTSAYLWQSKLLATNEFDITSNDKLIYQANQTHGIQQKLITRYSPLLDLTGLTGHINISRESRKYSILIKLEILNLFATKGIYKKKSKG